MNNFTKRAITGLSFAGLIITSIFLGKIYFAFLFLIFSILGTLEFIRIFSKNGIRFHKALSLILSASVFISAYLISNNTSVVYVSLFLIFIFFAVFIIGVFSYQKEAFLRTAQSTIASLYIALPLGLLLFFFNPTSTPGENQAVILLGFFLILWANDTGAYLTGSLIGKNKMAKNISPKKTWEGAIGGLLCSLAGAIIMSYAFSVLQWEEWIIFAIIIVLFGSLGDLMESVLKRNHDMKDTGNFFPGHGGILDRFDSILIAAPFSLIYLYLIFVL